ncbi:hypothetical protein TREMEDRAFT_27162 [Tremella mesenterica DSM 1558]|uniref:uncharacterized protein n=1 Tax=Tremella mesenterica (strain ATCC 24925 / CBS 8224 / DSM 1558 / NBRC 9311 / NRRL Y-6157 / RJB 2259-6 / UBC 559-6) TaxID=578456 RepID=UPI0003F4A0BF|nr:uncharacterized protein TREMEDRAFT_27162 [Tremella mesenterica DSM 1558]EIW71695.1 hypothetical protein TREMEDRAFT_27162 [Tremella mesenterica DSM 1558]
MVNESGKRSSNSKSEGFKPKRPRPSDSSTTTSKPNTAPRPVPSFLSSLQNEETDFPRGGGTTLTALELKQTLQEGRREADAEVQAEVCQISFCIGQASDTQSSTAAVKRNGHQVSERQIKLEELSYKRLTEGMRILTRIHTVLPLHLIVSLPNNLLAHVPITEISTTLTRLLSAEEAMSVSEDEEEEDSSSAPDLGSLFTPGQYFPAKVLTVFPTASQSFASQYPPSETTRLAARVEMTLVPEKVNSDVASVDLSPGYAVTGEVISEEDKGWRVKFVAESSDNVVEGWLSKAEAEKNNFHIVVGQLLPCTISASSAGGRVVQLSLDHQTLVRSEQKAVSEVGSLLPGHLVIALITAVVPSGLNVKISGFYDGTIEVAHLPLGDSDIDDKYKVGKKVQARVIYEANSHDPRHFSLSALPHIITFSSPTTKTGIPLEQGVEIGRVFDSLKVVRIIPEWGVICRTDDGLDGFVHISHLSDERLPALNSGTAEFRAGTVHRGRVIGHSPLDGVLLFSFERKIINQVFMQVNELQVGQVLKGTIQRLTDQMLFVNINGSVDGIVRPLHYADIVLKHPEKRFRPGSTVRARVFSLDPARNRVVLTLKRTLIDSPLDIPTKFENVRKGQLIPAVISKILDKGCLVDLFGDMKAFLPQSEASEAVVANIAEIFYIGKPVNVRVIDLTPESQRIFVSVRQAKFDPVSEVPVKVGEIVNGIATEIHPAQILVTLTPSRHPALLSLRSLAIQRKMTDDELRSNLKVGEKVDGLRVVSKNPTTGLLIVAYTTRGGGVVSVSNTTAALEESDIQPGQIISGRVASYTPVGTIIQLGHSVRGVVHPCDASDDFAEIAEGDGPLRVGEEIKAYVLAIDPISKAVQLSTRVSRAHPDQATESIDPEVERVGELQSGQSIRGLVKHVAAHGLFVALGRTVTARVMIRELFDDFVKEWESHFHVNQLVSGKILSVDEQRNQVEMTLRQDSTVRHKREAQFGLSDFKEGQKVIAVVKRVERYGMFLRIEGSGVSGLCHKSEVSHSSRSDVSEALLGFRPGDKVKAMIVSVNRESGKIDFGIKASYFNDDDFMGPSGTGSMSAPAMTHGGDAESESEEDGLMDEDGDDEDLDVHEAEGSEEHIDVDESVEEDDPKPSPTKANVAPTALRVSAGFDWSGRAPSPVPSSSSSSASDEDLPSSRSKFKKAVADDLTSTSADNQPSSSAEFERALFASPNSSFLWIQYMSFQLQLHEVDKARRIGREALEKITYREEGEKLNVWMALINLELGFGTEESTEKVFKKAVQYNDARTVYIRYAEALTAAADMQMTEEIHKKTVKKFGAFPESWTKFASYYLAKGDTASARALLPRAMKSLESSKHLEMIEKMAVLEFKHGDAERGKTLFEGLLERYPKKLDLWSVYIDQLAKVNDIQAVRTAFDRALDRKLNSTKAKFLFKKWLNIEMRIGDVKGQEKAKERAREWVANNVKVESEEEGDV